MIVDSPLSPKQYKAAVRSRLENYRNFLDERYTGRFIGPVFYITQHSYWEWNRRVTGEMNNAIGFIKKTESGCSVHFIHTTGILNPFHLILFFLFFMIVGVFSFRDLPLDKGEALGILLLISFIGLIITALMTAISDALTENGLRGESCLYELMMDPTFGQGE